ncbi:MAG: FAD-dependent oxidoreductase [Pseudonocardia sp.]
MRVVILGGGMAGLAAAWALTEPSSASEIESVTVYQRGWRLGGKGASSRGVHGRIEEHGLHVWLGYYHNAFRLMREVYDELDRPSTAPGCPIASCQDAFVPAGRVGVAEQDHGHWSTWMAAFSDNAGEPGTPSSAAPLTPAGFVRRSIQLLLDLSSSLGAAGRPAPPRGVVLSASPRPPGEPRNGDDPFRSLADLGGWAWRAETAALVAAATAAELLGSVARPGEPLKAAVVEHLDRLRLEWTDRIRRDEAARRIWQVAGLVLTCARGALSDGLLSSPAGFAAIDHLDFREWLTRHGAAPDTVDSPLVRGMYDLVFAYQHGDHRRPRFAAGLGLFLASKFFFEYTGSIFYKMRAGMGDVVVAPLYEALRARGVRFQFFSRLDQLHLSEDRRSVLAVRIARQARLATGVDTYDPLVDVRGLPCFPAAPKQEQLAAGVAGDLESHWADRHGEEPMTLTAGVDFDAVVLATSLGMVPHVCGELLADSPRWRGLVDNVPTVATQAAQLWLRSTDVELGVPDGGPTVSGLASSFETYASMAQVLDHEEWPDGQRPATVAYLCGTLTDEIAGDPATAGAAVRRHAVEFLERRAPDLWPRAMDGAGRFRWDLLIGDDGDGVSRLDSQYWTANVDPSDRYVQSVPGSLAHRLRADESGYDNLFLAGDWVNCGLNAGCVEAAVMAGLQAANAVRGRPLLAGVTGSWYGLDRVAMAAT